MFDVTRRKRDLVSLSVQEVRKSLWTRMEFRRFYWGLTGASNSVSKTLGGRPFSPPTCIFAVCRNFSLPNRLFFHVSSYRTGPRPRSNHSRTMACACTATPSSGRSVISGRRRPCRTSRSCSIWARLSMRVLLAYGLVSNTNIGEEVGTWNKYEEGPNSGLISGSCLIPVSFLIVGSHLIRRAWALGGSCNSAWDISIACHIWASNNSSSSSHFGSGWNTS